LEELGIKWGRMEEAFEEGQGPHRPVKPVMMKMKKQRLTNHDMKVLSQH
jgi:hypothetical protein